MGARGRRSAEDKTRSVAADTGIGRAEPPEILTPQQSAVWRAIMAEQPAGYFGPGTLDLLVAYCKAVTEYRFISDKLDNKSRWIDKPGGLEKYEQMLRMQDRLSASLVRLGRTMRLTQQAKYRADAAVLRDQKKSKAPPWLES